MLSLQERMMARKKEQRIDSYEKAKYEDEGIKVIPYKKKVYGKNPGSSPEVRSGIEDINYEYKQGKAHLIEKRDNKLRQIEEQGDIAPMAAPKKYGHVVKSNRNPQI